MQHGEIIDRLGGNAQIARRLGRDKSTVSRWRTQGIPAVAWPHIIRIANMVHVELTLDDLQRASPKFGPKGTSRLRVVKPYRRVRV